MSYHTRKKIWKLFLLLGAVVIGSFTLLYTYRLTDQLKEEERKKLELWHEATMQLSKVDASDSSIPLIFKVISQNTTIPVVIVDENGSVILHRNLNVHQRDSAEYLMETLNKMKASTEPIVVDLGNENQYLYYQDSLLIRALSWFPIVQLLVVALFILVAYLGFSSARKAEQDQVWVGMSKETAHQLGTPTSSLLGWVDVLKMRDEDSEIANELEKDVQRLQVITDRFSKIGSKPEMKNQEILPVVNDIVSYLHRRSGSDVEMKVDCPDQEGLSVEINAVLFQWVLENLCKNAIDAIKGKGNITLTIKRKNGHVAIDVKDTGKGMHRNEFKSVFQPGYTTKMRGWGLGLSLAKRIVEGYHNGKLFVKESELGKGTTFRILLPAK
ncbi:sensor histidine kinase [Carboxylicivirga linearis]|uniref:histidine kinase n=1 Tax=Carboxylicivirga linearis TaxID=1628157 RepID=A0ABS5JU14_9BACT|nr:HAMP domain-containing sensor histidine kinase [Carboxylicivirga linearis]MBS2098391.1 HAMP domain-containing histidine kinase [Carboxylicivirga linearis]